MSKFRVFSDGVVFEGPEASSMDSHDLAKGECYDEKSPEYQIAFSLPNTHHACIEALALVKLSLVSHYQGTSG